MKKLILIALIAMMAPYLQAQKVSFKIKGSDTVLPLTQKEAEVYMKKNPNTSIMVTGGGSGVGISALQSGTTDIAQASRSLKLDEKMKLNDAGKAFKETIIAYDAIAFVVNPSNKVSKLTREQLEGIFTGKITNWKDIGGKDQMIIVVSREEGSGTRTAFQEMVMKKDKAGNENLIADTAILLSSNGAILRTISSTPSSVGYLSMGYLDSSVKALKVNDVAATEENVANGSYTLIRPLNFLTKGQPIGEAKAFIDWILSDLGQTLVKSDGYISAK